MDSTTTQQPSRVANSAYLKAPDSFPHKRTSYRRPVDAQPTFVPVEDSTMASTIPSNTARPVAAPASNGLSRGSSHRRRQSQHIPPPTTGADFDAIPAAPDVPRAPPSAYRDPYAGKSSSRGPPRQLSNRLRDPAIQQNPSRQQPVVQSAADRLFELRSPPYAPAEPMSGPIERRSSQRKPSVPDRSPLQKLEGKLDDISKEERRARILEAELAAQEKAEAEMRERRAREAAERQRVVSQPTSRAVKADPGPMRTGSTRRHVSMPIQDKPMSPALSEIDSEVGYDISEPWDPSAGRTTAATAPHRVPSQKQPRTVSASYRQPNADINIARHSSIKGKEPIGVARGSGSFRDRSAGAQNIHRKPVNPATGLGLVGVEDATAGAAEVTRMDSRRSASGSYPSDKRRDSRGIMAAQMEMQQQQIDQKAATRGLDGRQGQSLDPPLAPANRKSVGFSEPDLEQQQEVSHEPHHRHHFRHHHDDEEDRRYIAPPMLEEWKMAPIGTLVAGDLDLDAPVRSTSTNKAWWEESQTSRRRRASAGYAEPTYDGYADHPITQTTFNPPLYLKCGPLLRYTGLRKDTRAGKEREIWRGSVMIVTEDAQSSYSKPPVLRLFKQPMDILPPPPMEVNELDPAYVDPVEGQYKVSRTGKTLYVKPVDELEENEDLSRIEDDNGLFCQSRSPSAPNGSNLKSTRIHKKDGELLGKVRDIPGVRLHVERGVTFWRFNLEVELGSNQARIAYRINQGPPIGFWVPAKGETMNIMFHSCNGFSFSVDSTQFCGPDPMWRDVLNTHQTRPFHVMIGGGDQIYNDAAMRQTTLFKQWTEHKNPLEKHNAPFTEAMQNELEQFYLDRYSMWFSQGMFGMANSQIPMVNIWDDHDIIDGYGSYPHHFMQTPVFTGIGAVAFKYYMLFQHQSVPSETEQTEPSWVIGKSPGPYIKERSRSVFVHLGREVAFLGLDCRTERQRDEILTEDSYDVIFDRLEDEIIKGETKHLIVLLGVPIAYPRLNFLENILTSRLMDPIKAMGRAGMLGNFVNKFDGGVEILDDLDDHWTAKHHKEERNWLIRELQHIASTKSVRVTILGGDVHLAAVGQFFSNKKLNIPKDKDYRYMPNIVSSAIVNTPPPDMMADIINKRNKIHHFDSSTDENMIPIFTHGVDGKKRNNNHLLPHRNWCSIRAFQPGSTPPGTPSPPPTPQDGRRSSLSQLTRRFSSDKGGRTGRSRGPPVSYYNNPSNAAADELQTGVHHQPQSSFSPDRSESERPRSRRNSLTSLFRRRASVDSMARPGSARSAPGVGNARSESLDRPSTFHRRPSVLGKQGLKTKGDYVDLQGGLDICLNMEVSQHDPAGITVPYRLIVPALDYTPSDAAIEQSQPKKGGAFGGIFKRGSRKSTKVGDDGYSMSGSESGSELGEVSDDEEEQARQRYKVGPRILIPGFGSRKKREISHETPPADRRLSSGFHTNDAMPDQGDATRDLAPSRSNDGRRSMDVGGHGAKPSAWENVAGKRHVSAPHPNPTTSYNTTQATVLPARSNTISRKQPTSNSSHKSQLPASASAPAPEPEPKVYRRSMGGILNQHGDSRFERDAHVLAHTPSRSKRESYPPHPAIVGAGPGSPYSRDGMGMQAREDTAGGDYFASGGRDNTYANTSAAPHASSSHRSHHQHHNHTHGHSHNNTTSGADRNRVTMAEYAQTPRAGFDRTSYPSYPAAGVGARYLGGGRYEEDDEEYDSLDDDQRSYSHDGKEVSQESFVPPKPKKKWQIWK